MNTVGRGTLMLCVGLVVGRLVLDGSFGDFVQQRMRWPLAIAAVFVVMLGVVDILRSLQDAWNQNRSVGPAVGWFLIAPVIVLMSVAPSALGASAADRVEPYEPPPPDESTLWALPEDDPFEMTMLDFVNQAFYDEDLLLEGREVILEGIVVNDPDVPGGFLLVRFVVSCCAADGIPVKVALFGAPETYDNDQWVRATVTWRPPDDSEERLGLVEADVISIELIDDPPDSPYESPF